MSVSFCFLLLRLPSDVRQSLLSDVPHGRVFGLIMVKNVNTFSNFASFSLLKIFISAFLA